MFTAWGVVRLHSGLWVLNGSPQELAIHFLCHHESEQLALPGFIAIVALSREVPLHIISPDSWLCALFSLMYGYVKF